MNRRCVQPPSAICRRTFRWNPGAIIRPHGVSESPFACWRESLSSSRPTWACINGGSSARRGIRSGACRRRRCWIRTSPDAAFGALAYLGDAIFGLAGSTRRWQCRPWLVVIFGIDVIPLGIVSAILVVLQGTVVGSWCFLCICTAVISLLLVYLAVDEVYSCLIYLYRVWKQSGSWSTLGRAFCGYPTADGIRIGAEMTGGR
jgi:hypothetical protein